MNFIDILMATYNGDKYIESQLLSIIGQSCKNWRLIIHDDGSIDNTIHIIKKWTSIDNRIILIEDGIRFKNAASNFMHLLQFANSPYIMFCDQDDIWFDNKIEMMYDAILQKDNSIPQIVYSAAYNWTESGAIGQCIPIFRPTTLNDFLFLNAGINGCLAIFNDKTLKIMKNQYLQQAMHDHILQLVGIVFGKVHYIDNPLMLYRRHEYTVTKPQVNKNILKRLIRNIEVPVIDSKHYNAVALFMKDNSENISEADAKRIKVYLEMPKYSFSKKIKNILKFKFNIGNSIIALIVKIFIRPFYK